LKSKCEAVTRESAHHAQVVADAQNKVRMAEQRVQEAEKRVQEAERALHDLAGKNAVDNMAANRKVVDLENKISELNHVITSLIAEFKQEVAHCEQHAASIRDRIARFGV
jgi:capsule polysaccharide export protein KpsE/RkpR